jgi:hypothetical protein
MKTMLLAAAAVLAIGAGSAFAGDGDGQSATTLFTPLPGEQVVPALATSPAMAAIGPTGVVTQTYATTSHASGTWLFPPDQVGGGVN